MNRSKIVLLLLHLVSLVLLALGLLKDMLQIDITARFFIALNLFKENKSIIGALQSLWQSQNYFPFSLICLFGIIIPVVKAIVIFYLLLAKQPWQCWYHFVSLISKWAMADVFAISIFTAFSGANAMQNTSATLQPGFYFFAAYVLLSGLVASLLRKIIKKRPCYNV